MWNSRVIEALRPACPGTTVDGDQSVEVLLIMASQRKPVPHRGPHPFNHLNPLITGVASATILDPDLNFGHSKTDLIRKPPAINKEGLTGNIARSIGRKIEGSPNDFLRFAEPTHGRSSQEIL
jgi:hypothetical protein